MIKELQILIECLLFSSLDIIVVFKISFPSVKIFNLYFPSFPLSFMVKLNLLIQTIATSDYLDFNHIYNVS